MPGFTSVGASVHVELEGPALVLPATVRLRLKSGIDIGDNQPAVVRFSDMTGWDAVPATVEGRDVVAQTEHFTDLIAGLQRAGKDVLNKIVPAVDWLVYNSGLVLRRSGPTKCDNTVAPAWVVQVDQSQDNDSRVRWCTQAADNQLTLRIKNNRPFAQFLSVPGVRATTFSSADPFTQAGSNDSKAGTRFWVRSGQQIDLTFDQPRSGSRTQRVTITPSPDIVGTIAVLIAQKGAEQSPDIRAKVLAKFDCVLSANGLLDTNGRDVVGAAYSALETCFYGSLDLGSPALGFARQTVVSVADWDADRQNRQPEIDLVVNAQTDIPAPTVSSTLPGTTTRPTAPQPAAAMAPKIVNLSTYREGALVYFRISYSDANDDAEGFGFRGVDGSRWAEETHPFSSPSYGRVFPGRIEYPFNLACGSANQYESQVEAWIYDRSGLKTPAIFVALKC